MEDFFKRLYARYIAQPEHKDPLVREEKEIREHQSEEQIDKTIEDSFPASDPPGNY